MNTKHLAVLLLPLDEIVQRAHLAHHVRKVLVEGRGEELRAMLGVDEVSPQSSRKFRNHFEHFDERLEAWAAEDHAFLYDCNVGPMGMFGNVDTRNFVRHFDPNTSTLMFGEERYELAAALQAVSGL